MQGNNGGRTMEKTNARKERFFWQTVLCYLTGLLLVVQAVLAVLLTTVFSPRYMQRSVQQSGYAATALQTLENDLVSYGAVTFFSEETMTSLLTAEQLEADMNAAITRMYEEGVTDSPDYPQLRAQLLSVLAQEAQRQQIPEGEQTQEAIALVADAVVYSYSEVAMVPLGSILYSAINRFRPYVVWGSGICGLFLCVSIVVMLRFCQKSRRRKLRSLIVALAMAMLVCLAVGVVVPGLLPLRSLALNPPAVKALLVNYVEGIFTQFFIAALLYLAVTAVLAALLTWPERPQTRIRRVPHPQRSSTT